MKEMDNDYMELESYRYSNRAFWCLPLSSGRIAVLTPRRDLFKIVEDWEQAKLYGPSAEAAQKAFEKPEETLAPRNMNLNVDLDL